uniref:Uncharacterized protein n=1 Tax=uncultured Desulfobacterium sp. TaxID=201089 RepID=E1Y8W4_9BACT|nr:unknown protein [uncultured Desulfobacterium sp.]
MQPAGLESILGCRLHKPGIEGRYIHFCQIAVSSIHRDNSMSNQFLYKPILRQPGD